MSQKVHGNDKPHTKAIKMKGSALAVKGAVGAGNKNRFEAPQQTWADLDDIYQSTAEAIVETGNQINTAISVPGVRDCVENKAEFSDAIKGLTRDLETFTNQLVAIKKKHTGRTGPFVTPQDNAQGIEIFEEYVQLSMQFKAITLPTVLTIMEHISQSYNKLANDLGVVEKVAEQVEAESTNEIKEVV